MPTLKRKSEIQRLHRNKRIRSDPEQRAIENQKAKEGMSKLRSDPEHKAIENKKTKKRMSKLRSDTEHREIENWKKKEVNKKTRIKQKSDFLYLLGEYEKKVREGPTYVCSSCGGLWYRDSVYKSNPDKFREKGCDEDIILKIFNCDRNGDLGHFFCSTCWKSVRSDKPKIPKLCLTNGFDFPTIPHELADLSPLEERLVALRLPFVQIRSLGADRQFGMQGNIVNVMNDLDTSAKVLPQHFDQASTVQVMLMRRLCYKRPFMYETIRPAKVYEAAKYLAKTNLYKAEGVTLSDAWAYGGAGNMDFVVEEEDRNRVDELQLETDLGSNDVTRNDIEYEDDDEQCQQETLVIGDAERSGLVHRIAPGEGKRPLSLLRDLDAEVLSFPTIYAGVRREFDPRLKISYTDISKSEARRYDRRCCGSTKILYAYKLSQKKRIAAAIQLCLRKKKGDRCVTAGQVRSDAFVEKLVQHDDGYRMLKGIRGSPAYWESQLKKVMAMLRQLGIPTLFMTLSAAETKWPELLVILVFLLRGETITEEEAMNMTFQEKSDLIRNDPITCARNFDHRLRSLLNILLKKPGGVFSLHRLVDYFLRDEFQQRGSPHSHGLYWLENAPIFIESDPTSIPRCLEFIDKYITCERKETDGMEKVIQYQIHKHTHTCKKNRNDQVICRFGFPVPPMKATTILFQLPEDFDKAGRKSAQKNFAKVKEFLTELGRNYKEDLAFEDFLERIGLTEDDYIISIRSSIKRPTVFLKRSTNAIFVNPYNEVILKATGANMDIQFILDPYSCAKYCVSYLAKDDSGVSKLLRKISDECRQGNTTVKDRLRKYANTFTNFVEISAQEAAYGLLGMPLIRSSVFTEYINTSPPEERVFLIKPLEELEKLPEDSTEISVEGVLSRYCVRPLELENTCLADYVALYNYSKTKKGTAEVVDEHLYDDLVEENMEEDPESQAWIKCKTGWLKRRTRPKIIRYRRYGEIKDPDNFYREMIMLYVPWRDESIDILSRPAVEIYIANKALIDEKRKYYDMNGFSEDVNDYAVLEDEPESEESGDPEIQIQLEDNMTDIYQDMGLVDQNSKFDYIKAPKVIPDNEYWDLIRSLNEKQRRFFLHIVHKMKIGQLPFYELLHGGAGVGKSRVIFSLVQSIVRNYSKQPGRCPDDVVVLVAAFTGKAACNVFGLTLHSAFRLPNSQNTGDIVRLVDDVCNTLRSKLLHLKLIIIDEISMVSVKQLYQINSRLQQVFQNELPFGGISILAVGHFRQLKPVMARYIFEIPKFKVLGHVIGNSLWPLFRMYELTEIMRQKGQLDFCTALNNMAEGCMTDEDIALIRAREISNELIPPPHAIRLFYSNADCHHYNMAFHSKLGTEEAVSTAIDRIQGQASDSQKEKLMEQAKNLKVGDADGLPYKVHLQVAAEFFVSTNVDVSDGLFNGCTGKLMRIDYGITSTKDRIPVRAWLDFRIPFFGANARVRTSKYQITHSVDSTWTAIDIDTRVLSRTQRHRHQIVRKQIPLVEANAITVHKSQSSSMEEVVVCVKKKLSRELLYVACSRACRYEGLYIDGEFQAPLPPLTTDAVTLEMERLRQNPVDFSLRFLQDVGDSHYKLIYHNVQSLHRHYLDILCDVCYSSADIMAFVEPWTMPGEGYEFPNFTCVHRIDCQSHRNSYGSIVFSKDSVVTELSDFEKSESVQANGHHTMISWTVAGIRVIVVYRSPNSSIDVFYKDLTMLLKIRSSVPLIVIGDFNIDLNKTEGKRLIQTFSEFGLKTKLPRNCVTTDGGTQIDCCFSNTSDVEAWTYESVCSYHKPICVTWAKNCEPLTELMETANPDYSDEVTEMNTNLGDSVQVFSPLIGPLQDLSIRTSLDHLNNTAVSIMDELSSKFGVGPTSLNISSVRNYMSEHSNLLNEMNLILSTSDLQSYAGQMVDTRSSLLLPHPMLQEYVPVYTPSDGNCFYNAAAISLLGDYKYHLIVRLTILYEIVNGEDKYIEFLRESLAEYSYADFVFHTMKPGTWADPPIMFVASKVCRRRIYSYDMEFGRLGRVTDSTVFIRRMQNPQRGDTRHQKYLYSEHDASKRPICIHYRNMVDGGVKNHFVTLVQKSSTSTIFPCLLDVYQSLRQD